MYFDKRNITNLEKYKRINLINSITGIKPVILVGTKSIENITNLAIFSSIVHISSNPPLLGFFLRANRKIRRDTFENIIQNNSYTFNHISSSMIKRAHQTSAKFDKNISEFDSCKFTEEYIDDMVAPYVKESNVKIGMKLSEVVEMDCTDSKLVVGEINQILISNEFLEKDFSLNLEKSNSVGVCGLNHYYSTKKNRSLPYARLYNNTKH
tara:strand:+ start:205 stop:834 length:630 start_codon:yes stop_codon:yes gene_type:complete